MTILTTDESILKHGFRYGQTQLTELGCRDTMSGSRELPMPNTSRITSLHQAHATLLLCWSKLSKFNQEQTPTGSFAWSPGSVNNEREMFAEWLEQWEAAFTEYLSSAMSSMTNEDVMQSRILKANHLAGTILASDVHSLSTAVFEAEFLAIIELAGAVLRSRFVSDSPQETDSNKDPPKPQSGLDVHEPLLVVISRCHEEPTRIRANELLSIFYG